MTLQELTTRLQTLCHNGYSLHEIEFWNKDTGILFPDEIRLRIETDSTKEGYIQVKLGD